MEKARVGLVGCGTISDVYIANSKRFGNCEIVACADAIHAHAVDKSRKHGISRVCSVQELVEDPDIDLVLNLTTPLSHAEIDLMALSAGKSVYSEKPLAVDVQDGRKIIETAEAGGLSVGCAPDTFLGGRLQTARRLIDQGAIGEPVGGFASMVCHGHETWHPNPEFYYKTGAGPIFDMAPYYLTALVSLLGPVVRVAGLARMSFDYRTITSEPLKGTRISVEVPTHVNGLLEFAGGAIVNMVMSFDVWDSQLPRVEIYGAEGTLAITDADPLAGPNIFGGELKLRNARQADWNSLPTKLPRRQQRSDWESVEPTYPYNTDSRGVGLADMIASRQFARSPRANGALAFHVLEISHAILASANSGEDYRLYSTCTRPDPFPDDVVEYTFDA